MDTFLNDPYEDTQRRHNSEMRWNTGSDQMSNLTDLQFTVAPHSSAPHDIRSKYAMSAGYQANESQDTKDPFLETFDFLGSPIQQPISPHLVPESNGAWPHSKGAWTDSISQDNIFGGGNNLNSGADPLNNLDSLLLPDYGIADYNTSDTSNSHGNNGMDMFSSSQYFSPSTRGAHFGNLNSIVENSISPSYYSNTFSPTHSRHGSVSIPPPSNSYLSQHMLMSPPMNAFDGSYDTLKSPNSGSYLNSPPRMSLSQSFGMNLTPSYSNTHADQPSPSSHNYGSSIAPIPISSVPNAPFRKISDQPGIPKQLTSEEKAKRRREFHNAVERRRRDLIKEKIKVLGLLVPPSLLTPQVCAVQVLSKKSAQTDQETKDLLGAVRIKDAKPNKAFILQTSVDYIQHLHYVLDQQKARKKELEDAISKAESLLPPKIQKLDFLDSVNELTASSSDFNPDEFFSAEI